MSAASPGFIPLRPLWLLAVLVLVVLAGASGVLWQWRRASRNAAAYRLAGSYLELVGLLWELGRRSEADEPYRKAFAVDTAHRSLGDGSRARMWFDRAVWWMDKYKPPDDELDRIRAEAEALLADAAKR